jgi:two-component sensor histidine kinase
MLAKWTAPKKNFCVSARFTGCQSEGRRMPDPTPDHIAELEAELRTLRSDNARLRRLLDGRDVRTELRHRQRNSLAMLRMLVRASVGTGTDLENYVSHLEARVDAVGRVQAAIDYFGEPDLAGLIAGELLAYTVGEGERATLDGPPVRLQPHAAQVMALSVHELAVNAVEHGVLIQAGGRIAVRWEVAGDGGEPVLTLTWKETGFTGLTEPAQRGFGTEILMETLRYELKAATDIAFEPDGLRCTIRFPLPERVGHVRAEAPAEDGLWE